MLFQVRHFAFKVMVAIFVILHQAMLLELKPVVIFINLLLIYLFFRKFMFVFYQAKEGRGSAYLDKISGLCKLFSLRLIKISRLLDLLISELLCKYQQKFI